MTVFNFDSENLAVDWLSFNIQGLMGEAHLKRIATHLSRYFTPSILMSDGSKTGITDFFANDEKQVVINALIQYGGYLGSQPSDS